MTSPPSFLEYPWRWQMFGGRQMLVTDGGGMMVVLTAAHKSFLQTRDLKTGILRDIDEGDDIAKIIASAPEVRRHAQTLIHGIDIGLVRIETDADETLANVLSGLREALEKSGAV
jgi:hypothetical protein